MGFNIVKDFLSHLSGDEAQRRVSAESDYVSKSPER